MSKEDKDFEGIREEFRKLSELEKNLEYYRELKESITPNLSVDYIKENILNIKNNGDS